MSGLPIIATAVLASLSGWLMSLTGLPLGWLIGAMVATALASLGGMPAGQSSVLLNCVRALIGSMLGASFTPDLLASVGTWWISLTCLVAVVGVMFAGGYFLLRCIAKFDRPTSAFCAIPGGIAEMVLLSEAAGGDQTRVAIVHALRIALAILVIPILIAVLSPALISDEKVVAGPVRFSLIEHFWIAVCIAAGLMLREWKLLPAPIVIVPLILSATLHLTGWASFEIPPFLTVIVQIFIGINVGSRFVGRDIGELFGALSAAVMVLSLQIAVALSAAMAVASFITLDFTALVLAYSPGGLAEMSILALNMGRDVAFVGTHHVFRVFLAITMVPVLLALVMGAKGPNE